MLKLFEIQQQAILTYQKDMTKAINARTISEVDRITEKIDGVTKRQDKANDTMNTNSHTTEKINRINRNLKWYVIGLFGFTYAVCWVYETFNLQDIIEKLIYKL